MSGVTYFARWGLSINEGSGPVNVHFRWTPHVFIYLYLFGLRLSWCSLKKG